MKKILASHFLMRFAALASVPLCLTTHIIVSGECRVSAESIALSVLVGNVLLSMYPLEYEELRVSGWAQAISFSVFAFMFCFFRQQENLRAAVLCSMVVLLSVFLAVCSVRRFSPLRSLFQNDSVLHFIEDRERYFSILLLFALVILYLALNSVIANPPVSYFIIPPATALLVLQWRRAYSGRAVFLSPSSFDAIRELSQNCLLSLPDESGADRERMNAIYRKVLKYTEEHKPFLEEEFSIRDMAHAIGSNRVYVSQVINSCSGMNFRQFMNSRRIRYAVELMEKEPGLKLLEIGLMAGFHSAVSFNMSFKMYMNLSPSEYRRRMNQA